MTTPLLEASCHCGRIHLEIDRWLDEVTDCNCSICRRYGALWAYYSPRHVRVVPPDGLTDIYMWGDRKLRFHRCRTCGCVTHWSAANHAIDRMGVNARLMPPDILAKARVRHFDGAET